MAQFLSPNYFFREKDLSGRVPAVSTSITGVVGKYDWGACYERIILTQPTDVVGKIGYPTDDNYNHWYQVRNNLDYNNMLYAVRVVDTGTAVNGGFKVFEDGDYVTITYASLTGTFADDESLTFSGGATGIIVQDNGTDIMTIQVTSGTVVVADGITGDTSGATATVSVVGDVYVNHNVTEYIPNADAIDDVTLSFDPKERLSIFAKYPSDTYGNAIKVAIANSTDFSTANIMTEDDGSEIKFSSYFDREPESTEFAVAVLFPADINDSSNTEYEIVETFIVSTVSGTKNFEGNVVYFEDYINTSSQYILMFDNTGNTNDVKSFEAEQFVNGVAGDITDAEVINGYDLFANPEDVEVDLLIDGVNNSVTVQQYLIDSIAEVRKDCFVILTPEKTDVVNQIDASTAVSNMITYRKDTLSRSSSYAGFYGNYKYQFDRYSGKYKWVSLAGDIAGVFAVTDTTNDSWFAPAGDETGRIKNAKKLAFKSSLGLRNLMYVAQINPVVQFPSETPMVYGQKTLQVKPSAFDRVEVRRLFIYIEKSIGKVMKYFVFKKNTDFTRNQIVGIIEPALRDIQGREGLYDFAVECSANNNTGEVIDRNELVCDVYLQPTKSAEFLNFTYIATKTGADFNELRKLING
ncbi:phage tail sheath C-terminal domain-containing protein [uncultured Arcobacter sp.]|uniref:phage tail sheath C-terminal domain-containing protein n=1 Tax=uncultured Arcobacter sp. TaxID=165434 RepID=UPI0026361545|nr:phage tail sheath C-terminal domain-containing protein [uncultured Arcobacter sp.]